MHYPRVVRRGERTRDPSGDRRGLELGERRAGAQPIGEPFSPDLLGGHEHVAVVGLPDLEHDREAFVRHPRGSLRLAQQSIATSAAATFGANVDDAHHGSASAVDERSAVRVARRVTAELLFEPESTRTRGSRDRARGVHGRNRHIDSRN